MQVRTVFRTVRPFISAVAVIATASALVFAIYFTGLGVQWIAFLAGVLVTAILAEATRVSRLEWLASLRMARLSATKEKLEREIAMRKRADEALIAAKPRLQLIDEVLPTMVALIDAEGHCRYHNRAFMDWLHLRPDQLRGQHLKKILGSSVYQEIAPSIRQSLDGHPAHYERTQKMADGAVYRLQVEHMPQLAEDGKVSGFYMLINDITAPGDVQRAEQSPAQAGNDGEPSATGGDGKANQDSFVDSFSEQVSKQKDMNNIKAAIEKGDFRLYCQLIAPIAADSSEAAHYEVLVRLLEEEEGMMPPGAFFPLAEKYGLMPQLDRWVVKHVAERAAQQQSTAASSVYFLNVSASTIEDRSFPEFLELILLEYDIPGAMLCFEIPNSELAARTPAVAEFARRTRELGCHAAISGFGQERISFDLIRGFQVQFLKIDGSIIFNMMRDPVELAKITAIDNVAKKIGVRTIAELVENEETIAKLREIGIDYAQGFAISRPQPLAD